MTRILGSLMGLGLMLSAAGSARAGSCDGDEIRQALGTVAGILHLRTEQFDALRALLDERRQALTPLGQEIEALERRLSELLEGGADAALVGETLVEIHARRRTIEGVQSEFVVRFSQLLDEDQSRRWTELRRAFQLSPVLPAFRMLHLL